MTVLMVCTRNQREKGGMRKKKGKGGRIGKAVSNSPLNSKRKETKEKADKSQGKKLGEQSERRLQNKTKQPPKPAWETKRKGN